MKNMFLSLILASTAPAMAQAAGSAYYQIQNMDVVEVSHEILSNREFADVAIGTQGCGAGTNGQFADLNPGTSATVTAAPGAGILNNLNVASMVIDQVVNIGKKVWSVVELGRPVVNIQTDIATALPAGARCWQDLQTWQAPEARTYAVKFKNLYGMEVIRFSYRVITLQGGSVNGQGRYVGYATLQPADVYVAWGYKFNAQGSTAAVYNMGTKQDPIGALTLNMKYSIDTIMNHIEQSQVFNVSGNGAFKRLN